MNTAETKEIKINRTNHSISFKEEKLSETGQFTGQFHHRTIGPEQDISEESEAVQAACVAARVGYVVPEEVIEEEPEGE